MDRSHPENRVVRTIGQAVHEKVKRGNLGAALRLAMSKSGQLLQEPDDTLRFAIRAKIFKPFFNTAVSTYQVNDFEVIDYQLFSVGADLPMFRGPAPDAAALARGDYFCVMGAAQTFGRLVEHPYCALLADAVGLPFVNLSRAAAGPDFFLDGRLLRIASKARFVILQVMSGRSVGCPDYPGDKNVRTEDGRVAGSRKEFLTRIWNEDRKTAVHYVRRWNVSYLTYYRQLRGAIPAPVLLLWCSERSPDEWRPQLLVEELDWGAFPQLVGRKLYEDTAGLFDAKLEFVTRKPSESLRSRITGEPCPYFGDAGTSLHQKNTYYPDSASHEAIAAALAPFARSVLAGGPLRATG